MALRKILGRTTLVLAVLAALLLVTRAVLNYSTGRALEKFLAAEKAKGLPIGYADLGPACPGQDNAKPLWKAASALFDGRHREKLVLGEELAVLYQGRSLEPNKKASLREAIDRNRRSIDLFLEAGGLGCFQENDRRDPFKIENLMATMHLFRLLGFEAALRAEAGDAAGGFDEWIRGFRLARLTLRESNLIETLVAISDARSLLAVLNPIIAGREVTMDRLKAALEALDPPAWRSGAAGSWRNERIFWVETVGGILRGRMPSYYEEGGLTPALLWLGRPLVRTQLMRQFAEYGEIEALFREPYFKSRPGMRAFDARHENPPWYRRLPDGGISDISAAGLKEASLEALMETARVGLAARLYRIREKRWPERIADLVPDFLPAEPLDPFTGKPLVYRAGPEGLLVYSLGSNEKDDGGRGTFQISQLVAPKDDDWTWRDTIR